jgi:hypothetical protein
MTDAQIETLIDLEVAHAGIEPVPEPEKPPELPPVPIQATVLRYKVGTLVFASAIDAQKVADLTVYQEEYDWNGAGNDFRWLKPCSYNVESVRYYEEKDVKANVGALKDRKNKTNATVSVSKAYTDYKQSIADIRETVYTELRKAREFKRQLDLAHQQWKKFIKLAEGNTAVAEKFFLDAYKNNPDMAAKATDFKTEILYAQEQK